MYGHKQILQCLAVALILAVFNFHRSAIKRSKAIPKPKIRRPGEIPSKMSKVEIINSIAITNHNLTGYCIRYPFGPNIHGNYDADYVCNSICFDKYATWLRLQCAAHCCFHKRYMVNGRGKNMRKSKGNRIIERVTETRNCRNTFKEYVDSSAGLQNSHNKHVNTIIEPIHDNLMSRNVNELTNQFECEIQTKDELICENTTSDSTRLIKLETNYTQSSMDYHDFLFDASKPKPIPSNNVGTLTSIFYGVTTIIAVIISLRFIFKLMMTDHTESILRAMEMRQEIQLRMERLTEQIMARESENGDTIAEEAPNANPGHDNIKTTVSKSENENMEGAEENKDPDKPSTSN